MATRTAMIINEYPNPRVLVGVLLDATDRLNDQGAVCLTEDEAAFLRQSGYTAALGAGRYPIPRLPLELLRPHPSLHRLVEFWWGPRALALPPSPPPGRYVSQGVPRLPRRHGSRQHGPSHLTSVASWGPSSGGQMGRHSGDESNRTCTGCQRAGSISQSTVC